MTLILKKVNLEKDLPFLLRESSNYKSPVQYKIELGF